MNLFDENNITQFKEHAPLANRMRPESWDEFIGQEHIIGTNSVLRKAIGTDQIPSMIFWGPPGSGKTSLARLIARITKCHFVQLSAVSGGVKEVRGIIEMAQGRLDVSQKRTILFIDEVHRFNKAQQDAFLPYVEDGTIILIGATTENPSFEVNSALLSRSKVFVLKALEPEQIVAVLKFALKDEKRGFGRLKISIADKDLDVLALASNGDVRTGLNILEFLVMAQMKGRQEGQTKEDSVKTGKSNKREKRGIKITKDDIQNALQQSSLLYDRAGDEHYNTISAFIKSMRAGAVDAALHYLARMVAAGEDPLFIARRMVVFASEDVVSPTALVVANAVFQACQQIGFPECQENLAAGVVYLTQAKKDRSAYNAFMAALEDVKKFGSLPIPKAILNAPTKLMKNEGYGDGYNMYPQERDKAKLLPEKLQHKRYYKKRE